MSLIGRAVFVTCDDSIALAGIRESINVYAGKSTLPIERLADSFLAGLLFSGSLRHACGRRLSTQFPALREDTFVRVPCAFDSPANFRALTCEKIRGPDRSFLLTRHSTFAFDAMPKKG